MGRHQDGRERAAQRLLRVLPLLPQTLVEPPQTRHFVRPQRPAIGSLRQAFHVDESELFGPLHRLLANGKAGANPLEEAVDQVEGRIRLLGRHLPIDELDVQLPEIDSLELREKRVLDQERIVLPKKIETLVGQHVPLGSLEPDEAAQERLIALRDEVELAPEPIELVPFRPGQHLLDERLIVAEEPLDQVEAGRQATVVVYVDVPIRKRGTEPFARRDEVLRRLALGANQELDAGSGLRLRTFAERRLKMVRRLGRSLRVQLAFDEQMFPLERQDGRCRQRDLQHAGRLHGERIGIEFAAVGMLAESEPFRDFRGLSFQHGPQRLLTLVFDFLLVLVREDRVRLREDGSRHRHRTGRRIFEREIDAKVERRLGRIHSLFRLQPPELEELPRLHIAGVELVASGRHLGSQGEVTDRPAAGVGDDQFRLALAELLLGEGDESFELAHLLRDVDRVLRRGQGVPSQPKLLQVARACFRLAERPGNEREIRPAQLAPFGPGLQGRAALGLAAMAVAPGGFDIIADADRMGPVEVEDRLLGQLLALVVGRHRKRRERDPARLQNEVLGDELGRAEILVEQRRRHAESFAGVVEPLAAGRVDRKLRRRPDGHAGEIADRPIVFGVRQPTGRDESRVPRVLLRLDEQDRLDPFDGRIAFFQRRLQLVAGRHLPLADELDDFMPAAEVARDIPVPRVAAEIQVPLVLLAVVATLAVFRGERLDSILIDVGSRRCRERNDERRQQHAAHRAAVHCPSIHDSVSDKGSRPASIRRWQSSCLRSPRCETGRSPWEVRSAGRKQLGPCRHRTGREAQLKEYPSDRTDATEIRAYRTGGPSPCLMPLTRSAWDASRRGFPP